MNKFKFELHTHTIHSDGSFTPKSLVECAKKYGYTGIALTDHNTQSGCKEAIEWGEKLGLVVISGIEWTTFYGHLVVLGGHSNINWNEVNPANVIEKIIEAKNAGDVVGLAHPYRVGYPVCTGGRNNFPSEIFEHIDFYEAISGEVEDLTNKRAKNEYFLLKEKYDISATYGRDWHCDNDKENCTYGATYLLSDKETLTTQDALYLIKTGQTMIGEKVSGKDLMEEKQ